MPELEQLSEEQQKEKERLAAEEAAKLEAAKQITNPAPVIDPHIKQLNDRLDQLTQLMLQNQANVQKATVEAPKPVELPSNKEVWDDPVNAISRIIAAQNAPLNEIAKELKADRALTTVQAQIEMSPQYQKAKTLYPDFERTFKYQLSQVPAGQLNAGAAAFVLSSVVGSLHLNAPEAPAPVNNGTPNTPRNVVPANIPAHLRPSAPAAPAPVRNDAEPELNENEAILARRYGMTAKEYKAMQDGNRFVLNPLDSGKGA